MEPEYGGLPDRNMNVAGALLHAGHQEFINQNLLCHWRFCTMRLFVEPNRSIRSRYVAGQIGVWPDMCLVPKPNVVASEPAHGRWSPDASAKPTMQVVSCPSVNEINDLRTMEECHRCTSDGGTGPGASRSIIRPPAAELKRPAQMERFLWTAFIPSSSVTNLFDLSSASPAPRRPAHVSLAPSLSTILSFSSPDPRRRALCLVSRAPYLLSPASPSDPGLLERHQILLRLLSDPVDLLERRDTLHRLADAIDVKS